MKKMLRLLLGETTSDKSEQAFDALEEAMEDWWDTTFKFLRKVATSRAEAPFVFMYGKEGGKNYPIVLVDKSQSVASRKLKEMRVCIKRANAATSKSAFYKAQRWAKGSIQLDATKRLVIRITDGSVAPRVVQTVLESPASEYATHSTPATKKSIALLKQAVVVGLEDAVASDARAVGTNEDIKDFFGNSDDVADIEEFTNSASAWASSMQDWADEFNEDEVKNRYSTIELTPALEQGMTLSAGMQGELFEPMPLAELVKKWEEAVAKVRANIDRLGIELAKQNDEELKEISEERLPDFDGEYLSEFTEALKGFDPDKKASVKRLQQAADGYRNFLTRSDKVAAVANNPWLKVDMAGLLIPHLNEVNNLDHGGTHG